MEKRLEGRHELVLDPDLPIIDSHFHLFDLPELTYMLGEYLDDARAGHNIIASVYIETAAFMRRTGPQVLRPLGILRTSPGYAKIA